MNVMDKIFKNDEARSKMAIDNDMDKLKKSYKKNIVIKNPNTGEFWDQKFTRSGEIDHMKNDRFATAVNFIPDNTRNILDIGVGEGILERKVLKNKGRIKLYGTDIARKSLMKIKKSMKGNFKTGSIFKIPFKKKFDLVVAMEVLEHIPYHKVFTAYEVIKKSLRNKGYVIFSVPVNETYSSKHNPNAHLRRYSIELFKSELTLAGFKTFKEEKLFAFSSMYGLKKLLAKYILLTRWKPNVIIVLAQKK